STTRRPSVFVGLVTSLGGAVLVGGGLWAAMLQPMAGQPVAAAGSTAPTTVKQDVTTVTPSTTQPSQIPPPQTGMVAPTVLPSTALAVAPPTAVRPGGYHSPTLAPPPWSPPLQYTVSPTREAWAT